MQRNFQGHTLCHRHITGSDRVRMQPTMQNEKCLKFNGDMSPGLPLITGPWSLVAPLFSNNGKTMSIKREDLLHSYQCCWRNAFLAPAEKICAKRL